MKTKKIIFSFYVFLMILTLNACDKAVDDPNLNGKSGITFNSSLTYGTMTDQDGNTYKTIQIGNQTWMAENLRTTKYNDGSAIANVTDIESWKTLTTGAYANVNNTAKADSILLFGRLYNWYALNTGKLAPTGWHVATYAEWNTLLTYLGGENIAGGKVKEVGTNNWKADNTGATNETGFTAIPAGYCSYIDWTGRKNFESIGMGAYFWEKGNAASQTSGSLYLFYNTAKLTRATTYKSSGLSVRCIKD
jgi:uncharacterized protein (TIGR02145 family)